MKLCCSLHPNGTNWCIYCARSVCLSCIIAYADGGFIHHEECKDLCTHTHEHTYDKENEKYQRRKIYDKNKTHAS